jgi:hypothetical protein
MSWTNLDLKLQPCVSTAKLTISRTPVSSLHAPNLPATRGEVDLTRVNTGGVLESNRNFTQWGTWNRGGLNTCKVAKNVLTKMTGYSWVSANGALEVQRGMRRFVFKIERMTGPVQIGISAARSRSDEAALPAQRPASRAGCSVGAWPPRRRATRLMLRRAQVPETWNDPSMVNRAWFVAGSGALHNGAEVVHRSGKPLREGDMVGVEVSSRPSRPSRARADAAGGAGQVRLDEAEVTFRKLGAARAGAHMFGTACAACVDALAAAGAAPPPGFLPRANCLLWNSEDPGDPDGLLGTISGVGPRPAPRLRSRVRAQTLLGVVRECKALHCQALQCKVLEGGIVKPPARSRR